MKILIISTIIFIIFELLKLIKLQSYWELTSKIRKTLTYSQMKKIVTIKLIDVLYSLFLLALFFTKFWYVGGAVLMISIITATQIAKVIKNSGGYPDVRRFLIADGLLSILAMLTIILKTYNI